MSSFKFKAITEVPDDFWSGKRVLVRVDFNVPLANGVVGNDFRLRQALPTLQYLKERGALVTAVSHLGDRSASIAPVRERLAALLPGITLLENIRHEPGEEANDPELARRLAANYEVFVNDAFSVCHREHASVVGLPAYLPSYAGLLLVREVQELSRAFRPEEPFVFVLGGAKFATKVPLIEKFLPLANTIAIGGALANSFFKARGYETGASLVQDVEAVQPYLKEEKIMIPGDVVVAHESERRVAAPGSVAPEEAILDVGPATLAEWGEKIAAARLVLWNGPLGNFEKGFSEGTEGLAALIARSSAYSIVGGGDTIAAIEKLGLMERFSFVSTGGGAMLDFLASGTLPGLAALQS